MTDILARATTSLPTIVAANGSKAKLPQATAPLTDVSIVSRHAASGTAASPAASGRAGIPLRQIERDRMTFGASRLSYQVELRCRDAWTGLTAFADACGAAGLGLRALRCGADGWVTCVLLEDGTADLSRLDAALAEGGPISLIRWTTVIGVGGPGEAGQEAGAVRAPLRTAASA